MTKLILTNLSSSQDSEIDGCFWKGSKIRGTLSKNRSINRSILSAYPSGDSP